MKSLQESLLKNINQDDEYIKQTNIINNWLNKYSPYIINPKINKDFTIDAVSVDLSNGIFDGFDEFPEYIQFGKVNVFKISGKRLRSLRGCPRVCKSFVVSRSPHLKSLVGGPLESNMYGVFDCGIVDLSGTPTKYCGMSSKLTISSCTKLRSLEGDDGKFDNLKIVYCSKLKSLKGLKSGEAFLEIDKCGITNLAGCSEHINRIAIYNCDHLSSLEGCPRVVEDFSCQDCNKLKSLEGLATTIKDMLYLNNNFNLSSLKGSPKSVNAYIIHGSCFNDFKGITQDIKGYLDCTDCIHIKSFEGLPKDLPLIACFMRSVDKRMIMRAGNGQEFYSMDMITKWTDTPEDKIINKHTGLKHQEYVNKYPG